MENKSKIFFLIIFFFYSNLYANQQNSNNNLNTSDMYSPIVQAGHNSTIDTTNVYNNKAKNINNIYNNKAKNIKININEKAKNIITEERIGSKIAIRRIFLIPNFFFTKNEHVDVYIELQSISSSPLLITAAKINVTGSKFIVPAGYAQGNLILSEKISRNTNNKLLLFEPGEIKVVKLAQSFVFRGIMDFFAKNVINQDIQTVSNLRPYGVFNLKLIYELNNFIRNTYGKDSAFNIVIYERDYKPIIDADISLSRGGSSFDTCDIAQNQYKIKNDKYIISNDSSESEKNRYLIQYDSFIGETVNKIRKGDFNDSFDEFFTLHAGKVPL